MIGNRQAKRPGPSAVQTESRLPPPLAEIVVIDLTRVLAGPYCTMILADLGARVIKVERPGLGDDARQIGPFVVSSTGPCSAYFASVNRNKESIVLDLKAEADRAVLHRLLANADVLVENFSPGTMERMGLGWQALHERYPRLVMASISGFGQTGPLASKPAYDVIAQAMSGLMSITGEQGGRPVRAGNSIADMSAGLFGAVGIQAALLGRARSGEGTHVDIAMLDCQVALLENALARYQASDTIPGPLGSRHPSIAPFGAFRASDRWLAIAVGNDAMFKELCHVLGVADLGSDPRYETNSSRVAHVEALTGELEATLRAATRDEWLERLTAAHIPAAPLNDIADVLHEPQLHARGMLVPLAVAAGDEGSPLTFAGNPIKLSNRPTFYAPAPALDQHRERILEDFEAGGRQPSGGAPLDSRLLTRIHWRTLPFLVLCYLLAQLDRLNIGFAQFGLRAAIGLDDLAYGLAVAIFFAGYIALEVPSNLFLSRFGARRTFSVLIVGWGLTTVATMFVTSVAQFNVSRFLLGAFEAGFFPGVMLYLTYWYPPERRAGVLSVFLSALAISGILVGPLSGWIMDSFDGSHGLAGWQWLFLIEGLPAVLCGFFAFRFLADGPTQAAWLSPAEQSLVARQAGGPSNGRTEGALTRLLADPATYLLAIIFFGTVGSLYGLNFWAPLIIKGFGISTPGLIGAASALPYVVALAAMILWGRRSDRRQERIGHFVAPALLAAGALCILPWLPGPVMRLSALAVATAGVLTTIPIFWSIAQNHYEPKVAPIGLATVNSFGVLAGAAIPYSIGWLRTHSGGMTSSLLLLAGLQTMSATFLLLARGRLATRRR